jgi:predicted permease
MRERRGSHWIKPVARLRDGATLESTRRELDGIARDLGREHPDESGGLAVDVVPLHDELVGPVRPVLLTLYAAVAFVLLVACGNVANLLLMRGAARARELSIRAALGAGRGRLVRQLLAESLLLAVVGGVAGVAVAALGVRGLVAAVPAEQARLLPYLSSCGVDGTVLAYAAALSLVAGALFGALPAVRASRADPQPVLRQGGGSPAAGLRALRDGLVVAELALTVVLVSGAALFAHSLARVLDRPTGFRAERLLTMTVPLPRWQYASEDAQRAFYRALEQRVAALPGVRGVGLTSKLPLDYGNSTSYAVAGDPPPAPGRAPSASFRVVNPAYFATLGVPLRRGRTFTEGEDASAGRVVVVNEALARAAFGARDPLGRALQLGDQPATVVGVVGDVAVGKLEDEVPPTMYFSYLQSMDVGMRLAVRTAGDPYALVAPVRAAVRAVDPAVGTYQVYAMDDVVAQSPSVFLRRYPLVLVGTFAGVALVLALVGTYGVISYAVAQRGRELGIRIALGAGSASIRWAVLRHAGTLAAAGIAVGLAAATGAARLAAGLFYGVEGAAQPAIFGAVAALLAAMALLAALLPAQRATRADPLAALKGE